MIIHFIALQSLKLILFNDFYTLVNNLLLLYTIVYSSVSQSFYCGNPTIFNQLYFNYIILN